GRPGPPRRSRARSPWSCGLSCACSLCCGGTDHGRRAASTGRVIASEAKQSPPSAHAQVKRDCFASLAMTGLKRDCDPLRSAPHRRGPPCVSDPVSLRRAGKSGGAPIDNPPVNALKNAVRAGLIAAFEQAKADPEIAAVVLACAGRTFV